MRSRPPRAAPSGDRDADGIPAALDADDDGDLVLDPIDRPRGARSAQAARQEFAFELNLNAEIHQTANANAGGLTVEQMDALLSTQGTFNLDVLPGDSVELDCGGLIYCSPGGTGRRQAPGSDADLARFPECCDADSDGFGTITRSTILRHGATSAQIGTGDVLVQRVTTDGVETQYASTLTYVFASVPALVSYDDGQGNAATISYPVPGPMFNPGGGPPLPGGPGTRDNPFPVSAGPGGDIVLALTFWRPQRRPIAGEPGTWIDIGGLIYETDGGNSGRDCPQRAYSSSDRNLAPAPILGPAPPGEEGTGGLRDLAPDRPSGSANTYSYTLDLSACLGPERWGMGEMKAFTLHGTDRIAYAAQVLHFVRR